MLLKVKHFLPIALLFIVASALIAQEPKALTPKAKTSYSLGVAAAKQLKAMGADIDLETLLKAFKDVYSGGKLQMEDAEIKTALDAFNNEQRQKQEEAAKAEAERIKKEGEAFLAENKTKEGVQTLPSGLQYKIIKQGDGNKPVDADTVEVNYRGTLINGTEFDSSYKRGKPVAFPVGGVIPGFSEALKLMPVGSKWQLFIPSNLAYGSQPNDAIEPNSVLIFEVELLEIK
jgi:FKBP-type peptidyl-prolyl cis-trans isomerase FklB